MRAYDRFFKRYPIANDGIGRNTEEKELSVGMRCRKTGGGHNLRRSKSWELSTIKDG